MNDIKKDGLDEAFEIILSEFRDRIVPKIFAAGGHEPHYTQVPIARRCDMFVKYIRHLEDKKLIDETQGLALELKYYEDVFNIEGHQDEKLQS